MPHNPCSFVGSATMLAGSGLASSRVILPGTVWWEDRQLGIAGVLDSWTFRLRWWEDRSVRRFEVDGPGEKLVHFDTRL
jgi:hypothetical protein